MEIRSLSLPVEFPSGEAGLRELGRLVARLRTTRGICEASVNSERGELRLTVDAAQFSTARLEYELGLFGVQMKFPIVRRVLLLERLDAPETARAIAQVLNAFSSVLVANVDFAAALGRVEYLASVSPDALLAAAARFGVVARFADAPVSDRRRPLISPSRASDLLALFAAVAFWSVGAALSASSLALTAFPLVPTLFLLAALGAGGRSLGAALRCARQQSSERNALLALCWSAGLTALGHGREAALGLIVLRSGEFALAAALFRFRAQIRRLPPAELERFSLMLSPANPYAKMIRFPGLRWLFLMGLLTAGFAVAPSLLIPGLIAADWSAWAYRGLVLLPLASSDAFHVAASVAVSSAQRCGMAGGLWFRGGAALKSLASARGAAFAKTGVLTQGDFVVEDAVPYYGWTCADVLRVASILQTDSRHPLARALRTAAAPFRNVIALEASDCLAAEGGGVAGTVDDIRFFLGSRRWMQQNRVPMMRQAEEAIAFAEAQGNSISLLGVEGGLLGLIVFRDTIRADAPEAVIDLRTLGIAPQVLISGDGDSVAARTAQAMGLDATAGSFGERERAERLADLRQKARGPVFAIGDGAFDAALLDAADAGLCLNAARPAASLFATVTTQSNDFISLSYAIRLARRMDAALLRVWGLTLTAKVALLAAAILLPLSLPVMALAESLLALLIAGLMLLAVPLRLRRTGPVAPPVEPFPAPNTALPDFAAAPFVLSQQAASESAAIPEPLLELVFYCDPSADEEPNPDRVYPDWEPFIVPFYGDTLHFGRKSPTLSLAVQVEDEGISRLHGEMRLDGNSPIIMDLHSTNGIRRNGRTPKFLIPCETPTPVKFGDTLYVGRNTRIEIRAPK